jgi:hypothetical protein
MHDAILRERECGMRRNAWTTYSKALAQNHEALKVGLMVLLLEHHVSNSDTLRNL